MKTIGLLRNLLLVTLLFAVGCGNPKPAPDPMAVWSMDFKDQPAKTIEDDYHNYIQHLPNNNGQFVSTVHFFEDGTGRHAITIEIGINGSWWMHVLIYDKDNSRIKVMKYRNGNYRS